MRAWSETLLHPNLTARRVWWVSPSLTSPESDVNQTKTVLGIFIAFIRAAAFELFWRRAKMSSSNAQRGICCSALINDMNDVSPRTLCNHAKWPKVTELIENVHCISWLPHLTRLSRHRQQHHALLLILINIKGWWCLWWFTQQKVICGTK